ncbi:flippase-like domain-containing protein [Corallococcus exiguus]|uniref:lysylphosphatidylglycerol synthase transmembrane domain-containing protein n=1 Tax=Corallococcus exiguus TaxID=83462 RepID=UPI00147257A8|nr:lysylphosphatidylglycerol synthase transmembrane domain-containing protein [Corallococcus exiguus]NNB86228.1 flippase-like domain-containing protein [Corallococcus exiguus]NNC03312.1 flippase-like domain-containing protein [Corallococcus exiguus]
MRLPNAGGRTWLKVLGGVVGLVLSLLLLSTAFFKWNLSGSGDLLTPRFPLDKFVRDLPGHLVWLVPFMLLQASLVPLRAVQWQATLRKHIPFKDRFQMVGIGVFVHNALPGKLGEVTRSFLLSRTHNIPFIRSLGSVGVCKLMEFACLMLLVALSFLGPFGETMAHFRTELHVALSLCIGLVALVVLLAHWAAPLGRWLHQRHTMPRVDSFLNHVGEGLGTARSFKGMATVFFFSIFPVFASALAYGLALHGVHIPGGLFAGAVVLGAISLGQSLPGVPAGMGIYYFVTSWAARALGSNAEDAAAFATLTHLGTVISQVAVGAWCVHRSKLRIRDLRKGGRLANAAAHHVAHEAVEPAPP